MRYVELHEYVDPRRYLLHLPMFGTQLPPRAQAFAQEPGHYDFSSRRCVKDLSVRGLTWIPLPAPDPDTLEPLELELLLGADPERHDEDLALRYRGVRDAHILLSDRPPPTRHRLGFVLLDELLPEPGGCLHEIAFWGGTIIVHAADVEATWRRSTPPRASRQLSNRA